MGEGARTDLEARVRFETGYMVRFGGTWVGYVVRDTRPLDWRILSDLSESIRAMVSRIMLPAASLLSD